MSDARLYMHFDFSAVSGYSDATIQTRLDAVSVDKWNYSVLGAGNWGAYYDSSNRTAAIAVEWLDTSYTQEELVQAYYDCITCIEQEDFSEGAYDYALYIDDVEIVGDEGAGADG